jgi:DNA-binding MarR family transcriptional regulator
MRTPSSTKPDVSQLLMLVSGYVHRMLRHEARQQKIPWAPLMVLKDLAVLGTANQRTLAQIEQISAPTMTVLLRSMEKRGWITRAAGEDDARQWLISITGEGRQQLKSAGRLLQRRLDSEIAHIPEPIRLKLATELAPFAQWLVQGKE